MRGARERARGPQLVGPWAPEALCLTTAKGRVWLRLPEAATWRELQEAVEEATGVKAAAQLLLLAPQGPVEGAPLRPCPGRPLAELGLGRGGRLRLLNPEADVSARGLALALGRIAQVFTKADIVIRGGTIVDGSGSKPFVGDVAIEGSVITAISPQLPVRGRHEVDARGLLVAPGWVDVHTHFDGQVTWDPHLEPSGSCGVTTCVVGNCGVGFAPCRESQRDLLVSLVESVEDIPGTAFHEGMSWDWETFEEYLDVLAQRHLVCDVGVLIGHAPVRTWVMGQRANLSDRRGGASRYPVRPDEIQRMAEVVQDAVAMGALGFSTSRILLHRDSSGVLTPGTLASADEMRAMGDAVAAGGGGILQLAQDFATYDDYGPSELDPSRKKAHAEGEFRWMEEIVLKHSGKVSLSYIVTTGGGEANDLPLAKLGHLNYRGGLARAQVMERPQAIMMSFASGVHPFQWSPTFRDIRPEDRARFLGEGGSLRGLVLAEAAPVEAMRRREAANVLVPKWELVFPWSPGYEPPPESSIAAEAFRRTRPPLEVALDLLLEDDGQGILWYPFVQYPDCSLEATRRALLHPYAVPGGADAGAHCTMIQDATSATHLLTHWARDRSRGPRIALETAVKKQTRDTALLFGLDDRGLLAPGMRADVNVIDHQRLRILPPYFAHDLPGGAGRWLQKVEGYVLTIVAGKVTLQDGALTGQLPGRLVRNPRADAAAWRGAARAVADPDLRTEVPEWPLAPEGRPELRRREAGREEAGMGLSALGRALRLEDQRRREAAAAGEADGAMLEPPGAWEPVDGKAMCETGCSLL